LWKAVTVNWNGDVLPCCDYVGWSNTPGYGNILHKDSTLKDLWSGKIAQEMRFIHSTVGRKPIKICSNCSRTGIDYKY
jgi:radical SAM protein with 4Fe4S-binding SPASM domain